MSCQHQPGLISRNGYYECPRCFQQVRHPWASDHIADAGEMVDSSKATVKEPSGNSESGIERMARERNGDWLAQAGVQRS